MLRGQPQNIFNEFVFEGDKFVPFHQEYPGITSHNLVYINMLFYSFGLDYRYLWNAPEVGMHLVRIYIEKNQKTCDDFLSAFS